MTNKEQIQQLIRQQEQAIRNKDIETSMTPYSSDILSFDLVNSLQKVGIDACRERLQTWLAQFPGPISYEIENLAITTGEDIAYSHSINHINAALSNGDVINMRWRATVCFQQRDGQWLITHEHGSVPFDPENGKALMDLKL